MAADTKSLTSSDNQTRARIAAQFRDAKFKEAYDHTLPTTMQRYMPLDKAVNILVRATQETPGLLKCDIRSLQQSVLDGAALGLEVAGPLQQSHLVPFKGRAKLIIGYRGFLELMQRTDRLDGAPIVQWVYGNDVHKVDLADPKRPIIHTPCIEGDRGDLLFVYILVFFKNGGRPFFDFRTKSQIEQHRDQFARKDKYNKWSDLWGKHFAAAGIKTMIRLASKHLPQSNELAQAVQYDQAEEQGQRVTIAREWDGAMEDETLPAPTDQTSEADKLANELGATPQYAVGVDQAAPGADVTAKQTIDTDTGEIIDAEFEEAPPPITEDPNAPPQQQAAPQEPDKTPPKKSKGKIPASVTDFIEFREYAIAKGITLERFTEMATALEMDPENARTLLAGRRTILKEQVEMELKVLAAQEAPPPTEDPGPKLVVVTDDTQKASEEEIEAIYNACKKHQLVKAKEELVAMAVFTLKGQGITRALVELEDLTVGDLKVMAEFLETIPIPAE